MLPTPREVPHVRPTDTEMKALARFLSTPWHTTEWNDGRSLDLTAFTSPISTIARSLEDAGWCTVAGKGRTLLVTPIHR